MNDLLSFREAAIFLQRNRRDCSAKTAREWIISALMAEVIAAECTSFNQYMKPQRPLNGEMPDTPANPIIFVPSDFWKFEHSLETRPSSTLWPWGGSGDWSTSNFLHFSVLTGTSLAMRHENWRHTATLGSEPVVFSQYAIGCFIDRPSIERLVSSGHRSGALIKKARHRPIPRYGSRITKAQQMRDFAKFCVQIVNDEMLQNLAANADTLNLIISAFATDYWPQGDAAYIDDEDRIADFGKLLREEATRLLGLQSQSDQFPP
jgi:hypothetical protein